MNHHAFSFAPVGRIGFRLLRVGTLALPTGYRHSHQCHPAMPFDFVDFDVKVTGKPQKFYRVRQP